MMKINYKRTGDKVTIELTRTGDKVTIELTRSKMCSYEYKIRNTQSV